MKLWSSIAALLTASLVPEAALAAPDRETLEEEEAAGPPAPELDGRALVALYNSGFQWGFSPGIAIVDGQAGFFLGARAGYGFDLGSVILVPGVRLVGFFTTPSVYTATPMLRSVFPIGRFAPFLEAGTGVGYDGKPGEVGMSLVLGTGFMVHFSPRVALGIHGTYEAIWPHEFRGVGVGPILAIGF